MELRSPSKGPCWHCTRAVESLPFCKSCGKIQELPEGLSTFALLNEPVSLQFSADGLRGSYFALSKQVHPDQFGNLTPRESLYATRWSRSLNQAYAQLKERKARAEAILETYGKEGLLKKGAVPLELAEDYFEFQEKVSEGEDLTGFLKVLGARREAMEGQWREMETISDWDEASLKRLADLMTMGRYVASMENDINKRRA